MLQYAVLIDGGFAKRKLGDARHPATAAQYEELITRICQSPRLQNARLHRVYYYDSEPLKVVEEKPLNGGSVDFGASDVARHAISLFEQLRRLPYMALRLGELTFNGWSVPNRKLMRADGDTYSIRNDDLKPLIAQKGVDMRIGMDIAALTLKKHVQIIVLVTGDSDFVPAMKFARREGAQLFLAPLKQNVRPSMHEHSDLILDLELPPKGAT